MRTTMNVLLCVLALCGVAGCGPKEEQKSQQELTDMQNKQQQQADQDEREMQKQQQKNKKQAVEFLQKAAHHGAGRSKKDGAMVVKLRG